MLTRHIPGRSRKLEHLREKFDAVRYDPNKRLFSATVIYTHMVKLENYLRDREYQLVSDLMRGVTINPTNN